MVASPDVESIRKWRILAGSSADALSNKPYPPSSAAPKDARADIFIGHFTEVHHRVVTGSGLQDRLDPILSTELGCPHISNHFVSVGVASVS